MMEDSLFSNREYQLFFANSMKCIDNSHAIAATILFTLSRVALDRASHPRFTPN